MDSLHHARSARLALAVWVGIIAAGTVIAGQDVSRQSMGEPFDDADLVSWCDGLPVNKNALHDDAARPGESTLVADWLFQTEGRPLLERAVHEVAWARELAARLARTPHPPDMNEHLARLDRLAADADRLRSGAADPDAARSLYLAVREVKRKIAFANRAIDFTRILCIDQPLPQGSESTHEAVHRLGRMAVSGGRLVMTDGLDPGSPARSLLPDHDGAFWRPDLSFDATRVLFCFKRREESSFHLHELDLTTGRSRTRIFWSPRVEPATNSAFIGWTSTGIGN